jgi:hypothetical protein
MKTYKTYQARNAVKAAQVTNHIKAAKKNGVSHIEAKAEAYRLYSIKAAVPSILMGLKVKAAGLCESVRIADAEYPPLPVAKTITKKISLPPLPTGDEFVNALPPLPIPQSSKPSLASAQLKLAQKEFNYDLEV